MLSDKKRKFVKRVIQQLGDKVLSTEENACDTVLNVKKQDLIDVCSFLYEERQARLLTMVGNDERGIHGVFALYYVFAFDEIQYFMTVKIFLDELDPTFPSLAARIPALNWYEREVNDLLGLRALGHPNRSPLVLHGDWPEDLYPLRKDYTQALMVKRTGHRDCFVEYTSEDITQIPVGPIHAGIIEPGHFRFGAVGDTVLHLDARLFYTHRGIEKSLEGKTIQMAMFTIERICCVCNVSHAAAFCQAVESAAQLEISERAKFLRVFVLELERLYNHVGDVGNICAGFGFAVGSSQGARLREQLLQLNEKLTGHRYLRGILAPGGLKIDFSQKDLAGVCVELEHLQKDFHEFTEILLSHEIAVNRMEKTGVLLRKVADDLEVVGIAARASGRDIDCRRDQPYAAYEKVQFDVPLKTKGDVLRRIKVRIREVDASISIIQQIAAALPVGDVQAEIPKIRPYTTSFGWVESPRGETCHWLMVGQDNEIYRCRIRSASYSNWPAVPLAVKGNIVPDFPLINKSFELCYSCCDR